MKQFNFGINYPLVFATISWGIIVFIFWIKGVKFILKNKNKNF
jgi:hypothetical protein